MGSPLETRARAAVAVVVKHHAEKVLADARRRVPKDSGDLYDSADVVIAQTPLGVDAYVAFKTRYAGIVHNKESLRHPHGGQAHYLTDALKTLGPQLEAEIAAALRKAF